MHSDGLDTRSGGSHREAAIIASQMILGTLGTDWRRGYHSGWQVASGRIQRKGHNIITSLTKVGIHDKNQPQYWWGCNRSGENKIF